MPDTPITTGFPALDKLTGGFLRKQLVTFAGESASGLSTALLNIAAHAAIDQKARVLFVDLESRADVITERLVAAVSGVPLAKIRGSEFTDLDLSHITAADEKIRNADLTVTTSLPTVKAIKLRGLDYLPRLIVIDGTRLLDFRDDEKVSEQLLRLSAKLKRLATSLDTTVCVSQPVARSVGGIGDEDLHPFAVDSDQLIMVRTYRVFGPNPETEMEVVKNRMGTCGSFPLIPRFECSRFYPADEVAA